MYDLDELGALVLRQAATMASYEAAKQPSEKRRRISRRFGSLGMAENGADKSHARVV